MTLSGRPLQPVTLQCRLQILDYKYIAYSEKFYFKKKKSWKENLNEFTYIWMLDFC